MNEQLGIMLRALARDAAHNGPDLWDYLPGDGPASAWLVDAVAEATGEPVVSASGAPVNMARVRVHLRKWGARQP